jgi:putative ABC transport system permease protein
VQSLLVRRPTPRRRTRWTSASRPTWAPAWAAAAGAFDSFFLGLGVEGLIVGAVGVASIMIISVLERRSEIGLRRALGATKGQIRTQLLAEWILLGLTGGVRSCDARRPTPPGPRRSARPDMATRSTAHAEAP